jgi:hypothetical protein
MGKPPNEGPEGGIGHGQFPVPSPGSRFYQPPASSKALRWSIVIFLMGPLVLGFLVIDSARTHDWTALAFALVLLCSYGLLQCVQIRVILRELARRRAGEEQ